MPVSGTTTFIVSRDQIIQDALESLGVLQDGEAPSANDITTCAFSLQLLMKALAAKGIPIWAIQTIPVPLVAGTPTYTIGPTGVVATNRPLRVYDSYITDPNGNSTPVIQISKQEYDFLSLKTSPGIPNQFYYAPLIDNGQLFTFPVINQNGYVFNLSVQRALYDMTTGATNFDLPQECYLMIKWVLAREVLSKYVVPQRLENIAVREANRWEQEAWDFEQEEASTSFSPATFGGGYFGANG